MHVFEQDAFEMIARVVDPSGPFTFIDVGANVGQSVSRIAEVFPKAVIHAFEPSPDAFESLNANCRKLPMALAWPLAVGASPGRVELNIMGDSQMSSVLPPSELGRTYYPGDINPQRRLTVEMTSLDRWVQTHGVEQIHAMKIDVQGLELEVLKGAAGLLASGQVRAVKCEAQLLPEYQGASTLFELVPFMERAGFQLHQIHEVWEHGPERQHSCVDALWLRKDIIDWLRQEPAWAYRIDWRRRMADAIAKASASGSRRVAIYAAGQHSQACEPVIAQSPSVVCFIDDNPARAGQTLAGKPILPLAKARQLGFDAVVLSSNSQEDAIWDRTAELRAQGIPVHRLYPPPRTVFSATVPACKPERSSVQVTPKPVAPKTAQGKPESSRSEPATPEQAFRTSTYLRLNARRLEHLASLGLNLSGRRVLEVGAGIGDLTTFFVDRNCRVHATDARADNLESLRRTFAGQPLVSTELLNMDAPGPFTGTPYDVVFCYGLLYHLRDPEAALRFMADACRGMLLLETCVSFGQHEAMNPVSEDAAVHSQATSGIGCRPTRPWVLRHLRDRFEHVYIPKTQPASDQFPVDWAAGSSPSPLTRAIFIASRTPIVSSALTEELLLVQSAA